MMVWWYDGMVVGVGYWFCCVGGGMVVGFVACCWCCGGYCLEEENILATDENFLSCELCLRRENPCD